MYMTVCVYGHECVCVCVCVCACVRACAHARACTHEHMEESAITILVTCTQEEVRHYQAAHPDFQPPTKKVRLTKEEAMLNGDISK